MPLKDVIYHTLLPYKEQLNSWTHEEICDLFIGFGNISIFFTEDPNHRECKDLAGTFRENGADITQALLELEIGSDFEYLDFYWGIASGAGAIREDLNHVLQQAGFTTYEYYHPDEDETMALINTVSGMKVLNLEGVEHPYPPKSTSES